MSKNTHSFWDYFATWEEAEAAWDRGAKSCAEKFPIQKSGHKAHGIPEIVPTTRRFLPLKSLWWMITKDTNFHLIRTLLKKPWTHLSRYVSSLCKKEKFKRDNDLFFYDIENEEEWKKRALSPKSIVVIGFSYCEKPFECPETRFSDRCSANSDHPVCRQCFIGKCKNALPEKVTVLIIPTIHYIGKEMLRIQNEHPQKQLLFCITACPLSLTMFADYGAMAGFKGIGASLSGRTCNTMKAFKLAEHGTKPQRTETPIDAQKRLLNLFRVFRS